MADEAPAASEAVIDAVATPAVAAPAISDPAPVASLMDTPPAADPAPVDPAAPAADPAAPAEPAKEGEEEKPVGAPEEYADFTAPEGVELDADLLGDLKTLGKENNWTQEQAQKVVDLGAAMQDKFSKTFADSVVAARAEWREQTTTDAEFGGKNLQPNLAIARTARETFGTPALKDLLDQSGLGDHPEVVRFFYKVGKATSEHDLVVSGKPSQPASFYDHPTSAKN